MKNGQFILLLGLAIAGLSLSSCCANDNSEVAQEQIETINKQKNKTMGTTITFQGNEIQTIGKLPEVGTKVSNFTLTDEKLNEKTFEDFKGQNLVLNIFPSIDTPVCAQSVRTFNKKAASLENTKVLCISKDLPFAQAAFCGSEGIENVVNLSDFRNNFSKDFGVEITEGALKGLMSRAVIVVNAEGEIIYSEQVPEIAQEPNYEAALASIQ